MIFLKKDLPYEHWEISQEDTGNRLRIVPERGGLITQWFCNGRDVIYFDGNRFLQKSKSVRGGIPILFPICGSLVDGSVQLLDQSFSIPQHGFARDCKWELTPTKDQKGVLLSLTENKKTLSLFPYHFLIEMEIFLMQSSIDFKITIFNRSEDMMPFSFGLHPYFKVMDLKEIKIEGLCSKCMNHLTMIESDTELELSYLEKGIDFLSSPLETVTLVDFLANKKIKVLFEKPMDLGVIWTDPPRSMVCIEPWTSPRNSLNTGDRLQFIKPGCKQEMRCSFLEC
ncbi:galactose mutarotase [Prochlorococcus sp. MIT 1341]|uniref:aldose epimerase family protein n=1 Tax=Prochlorococcus sp. MIT 1341 TaxID=3096221 RepID=UPI002A766137|nr:galactose mutarotase [Prochlorococcus sp. MIT 1341]